jgi:hypothetical protein
MTAIPYVTLIRCDGTDENVCPVLAIEYSANHLTTEAFRSSLASQGWETVGRFDLPPIDRCPGCGNGTC